MPITKPTDGDMKVTEPAWKPAGGAVPDGGTGMRGLVVVVGCRTGVLLAGGDDVVLVV